MSILHSWWDRDRDRMCWRINGCVQATVNGYEVRSFDDYRRLAEMRVSNLVGLAMPGHEDTPNGGQS